MPEVTFPNSDIKYLAPSWEELQTLTFKLAKQIKTASLEFDRVITLAKGGWTVVRPLLDFLEINNAASIGIKFYCGINQRCKKPDVYQDLPISVTGERVLLFDDVADTGESLKFAKTYLQGKGVASIHTATIYLKLKSSIKPDFVAEETSAWIIFPHEVSESITLIAPMWQKQGLGREEIINRFIKFNFKREWVEYYLK